MAATRSAAGPGSYPWLPTLADAASAPDFSRLFPNLAQLLQDTGGVGSPRSGSPTISPARRRLLERAAEQARPASSRRLGDANQVLSSEEQLLQVLADMLAQEREEIRIETESKLRAAFSAPPGERRTLIEAQRQKWRALEEAIKDLSELVKDPRDAPELTAAENKKTRDTKAKGAVKILRENEHGPTRQKVQLLNELLESYRYAKPLKEAAAMVASAQKMGGNTQASPRADRTFFTGNTAPGSAARAQVQSANTPSFSPGPSFAPSFFDTDSGVALLPSDGVVAKAQEEERLRQEAEQAEIRKLDQQKIQDELDRRTEHLERLREDSELKTRQIEEETKEKMRQELARQAERAAQKNDATAAAQAAQLEEVRLKMEEQEREKRRMEAEILAAKTQANEALLKQAEEKERAMREAHEKDLDAMKSQIEAGAPAEFKRQLAQNEAKQKQAEREAEKAAIAAQEAETLRAEQEDQFRRMRAEDEAKFASQNNSLKLQASAATAQAEALRKQAEDQEAARKQAEEEVNQLKKQAALASKMKGAGGIQRQKELEQKAEEATGRLKEAEGRSKVLGQMQNAMVKQQRADLENERQRWNDDKELLIQSMRTQQLELAANAVFERQRLLRANRAARMENYKQQWWSEVDVQRVSTAKHLMVRCAKTTKDNTDTTAAQFTGRSRKALGGARQRIVAGVAASTDDAPEDESMAGRKGGLELQENMVAAMKGVDTYKREMEVLTRGIVPGPEGETVLASFPSHAARNAKQMEDLFNTERSKIDEAKRAAEGRLREAEAHLDSLAADDIAADLASNWADTVGAMADDKRATERRQKDLQARIERQLALDTENELENAKSASSSAAAAAAAAAVAAEVERARKAEEDKLRVEAALREAEQQRLVPVRVKLTGFKMSQIRDREAFERAFAEKVRATLDLDESQLRVLEISSGTG